MSGIPDLRSVDPGYLRPRASSRSGSAKLEELAGCIRRNPLMIRPALASNLRTSALSATVTFQRLVTMSGSHVIMLHYPIGFCRCRPAGTPGSSGGPS